MLIFQIIMLSFSTLLINKQQLVKNYIKKMHFYDKNFRFQTFSNVENLANLVSNTSNSLRCAIRGRRSGGRHPLPFFENQKKCPDFAKKGPNCVHPQVKFIIQNVILRVSRRKNSKIFPAVLFFIEFLTKFLSKCPNFTKTSPALKNFWLRA